MSKKLRILLLVLLVIVLIIFRVIGDHFFYDPFLHFFAYDYLVESFVDYKTIPLFVNLFFRYVINAVLSILIVYLAFLKRSYVLFSVKFYTISFLVLVAVFYMLLLREFQSGYLIAFYIRRLLIHPVFLIILLPAFYYQRKVKV